MENKDKKFAVPKRNIIWILTGFAVMVLGFILLAGGGSDDPAQFSEAIFNFRRLVLAPIVIILGIIVIIVAILRR